MGFKYQGTCYDTVFDLNLAYAQWFGRADGSGLSAIYYTATATETHVDIQAWKISDGLQSGITIQYVPQQVTCDISLTDQIEFFWQLALVLVAGFAIRAIIKALQ